MTLVTRQSMVDDSGLFTDGTVVNKAFVDQIYDQVDDQCHSTTNPTIRPRVITDELIAARGALANLDARISTVIAAGGGAVIGALFSLANARSLIGANNVAKNYDLSRWTPSGSPHDWTTTLGAGGGSAEVKTGAGQADTYSLLAGKYSLKLTSGGTGDTYSEQLVLLDFGEHDIRGQDFSVACFCKAGAGVVATIEINDGVGTTVSTPHPADGTKARIAATRTISMSATQVLVTIRVAAGTKSAYFGGFQFIFGTYAASGWHPGSGEATLTTAGVLTASTQFIAGAKGFGFRPAFRPGTLSDADLYLSLMTIPALEDGVARVAGTIVRDGDASIGNVGGGTDDLKSVTLRAGVLNGDYSLSIRADGQFAANGNAKTLSFVWGGTTIILVNAVAHNGGGWFLDININFRTGGSQLISGLFVRVDGAGTPTVTLIRQTAAEVLTGTILTKMTCVGTIDNDVTQDYWTQVLT